MSRHGPGIEDEGAVRRVLLLGATFSTGNMGVGALAAGALTVIRSSYPSASIYFLDYGREPNEDVVEIDGSQVRIPLINLRFSWKVLLPNNILLLVVLASLCRAPVRRIRSRLLRSNSWLGRIASADLALAVSGGDSFSDLYGLERFFYVTLPQVLAILLEKPLVLLPQTVGPFKGRTSHLVARFLVRKASVSYARERDGVSEIKRLLGRDGDPDKARFCYDMGFVLAARRPACVVFDELDLASTRPELLVGLNVSGLLLMGGYDQRNSFGLSLDYRGLIEDVAQMLTGEIRAKVLLIPHVFGDHQESDERAVAWVYDRLKPSLGARLARVCGFHDQHEIKYIIGRCDFFIGSRMHACIAALSQEIPALGIAYSDKFRGVFESIGVGELVADPRRLDQLSMLGRLRNSLEDRLAIQRHLREIMPGVRTTVLGALQEVKP